MIYHDIMEGVRKRSTREPSDEATLAIVKKVMAEPRMSLSARMAMAAVRVAHRVAGSPLAKRDVSRLGNPNVATPHLGLSSPVSRPLKRAESRRARTAESDLRFHS